MHVLNGPDAEADAMILAYLQRLFMRPEPAASTPGVPDAPSAPTAP
ncbi:hypothetical protein BN873_290001 [Candidatus Competibacter denitrificans Run_A_D11]|uniref:Uncharacterized protein n=2 Tax=Candidatus Competibacter TaxID=221279 RepID=W6M3M4_9GAMM|nr:hypothetical protein BN873_290001 [Candidatus Competibacter denitrificans Run_A_D11]